MTDTDAWDPARTAAPRVSLRPALIVISIVAAIMIGGVLLTILSSKSATTAGGSNRSTGLPAHLVINGIPVEPARAWLLKTEPIALIPEDVISSIYVPVGIHLVKVVNLDNGNGPFDRAVDLTSLAPKDQLIGVYATLLNQFGWKLSSSRRVAGPSGTTGTELLSQRASSDGFNWEVGVTVNVGTPSAHPSPAGASHPGSARIALRLLQVPEGN